MGAKQSRASKITYYIEGESRIPQPGMIFKSESGKFYRLIQLISETDNSFNFSAVEWTSSIANNNSIQQISNTSNNERHNIEKVFVVKFIKILHDKIHMIQNELMMMRTFAKLGNNNNIIECYDYFVSDQENIYPYICIVTPYAQGGTLLDCLHYFRHSDQINTENTIKKIIHQLLLALNYLHTNNVAHRDLNLKNIFLNNVLLSQNSSIGDVDPIVSLADFGCATFIDDKENCDEIDVDDEENCSECDEGCDHCKDQMKKNCGKPNQAKSNPKTGKNHSRFHKKKYVLNQLVGTPVFVAPEMYEGKPYGVEVDIWSLGIVLYALMSGGSSPFPSTPSLEVMKWIVVHKQIEFPDELFNGFSDSAISLLKMMLNKDPSKRITAEAALHHPWFTEIHV